MSTICVLGSGRVGSTLAKAWAKAGHQVIVGLKSLQGPHPEWPEQGITFDAMPAAATKAEIVVNATRGGVSLDVIGQFASSLSGKILLDVANATEVDENGMPSGLLYPNSSLGELLQKALPETHVVKTLNTMLFTVMADPKSLSESPMAYLSGNDEIAKRVVKALLQDLGWDKSWIEDLGGIESAQGTEAFMALVPHVVKLHGFQPFAMKLVR